MLRGESIRGVRFAVGSAVLATLAVAATGCSSSGSGGASANGTPTVSASPTIPLASSATTSATSVASTASSTTAPPAESTNAAPSSSKPPSQPTGDYLKTLLPASDIAHDGLMVLSNSFVPGWTVSSTTESDSGPAPTAPAPALVAKDDCDYLIARKLDLAGAFNIATASIGLSSGNTPVGLALYGYNPGDAAKSLAQLRQSLASTCDGFTAMQYSIQVPVDVSATPVPGLGDEALLVKLTPKGAYIDQENLLVRRGNVTVSLWADNSYGSLPDLTPAAKGLIGEMG